MKLISTTALCAAMNALAAPWALAADVIVTVKGARADAGQVGCALFASDKGFPMDNSGAAQVWLPAQEGGAVCRFADVAPGTYAVSVAHDLNGNKRVDTNLFGIPKEGWAVSRNVIPRLRAPRFDEASFRVEGSASVEMTLQLVY